MGLDEEIAQQLEIERVLAARKTLLTEFVARVTETWGECAGAQVYSVSDPPYAGAERRTYSYVGWRLSDSLLVTTDGRLLWYDSPGSNHDPMGSDTPAYGWDHPLDGHFPREWDMDAGRLLATTFLKLQSAAASSGLEPPAVIPPPIVVAADMNACQLWRVLEQEDRRPKERELDAREFLHNPGLPALVRGSRAAPVEVHITESVEVKRAFRRDRWQHVVGARGRGWVLGTFDWERSYPDSSTRSTGHKKFSALTAYIDNPGVFGKWQSERSVHNGIAPILADPENGGYELLDANEGFKSSWPAVCTQICELAGY